MSGRKIRKNNRLKSSGINLKYKNFFIHATFAALFDTYLLEEISPAVKCPEFLAELLAGARSWGSACAALIKE